MSIRGLRIHIAGSAATDADAELLAAAHEFVRKVTRRLIEGGAGLLVGAGDEPIGENSLPCLFDWTALQTVSQMPDPAPGWRGSQTGRFWVVASQRGLEKIPDSRQGIWDKVRSRSDFGLETTRPGWRMGGAIRAQQVLRGDVLVVLGGGAGSEQLAELYLEEGKRVIPIHCDLGAITQDGSGGSSYLHACALNQVETFFNLKEGTGGAAARLSTLRLGGTSDVDAVATSLVSLLEDLRPRLAFYVRLLDPDSDSFGPVERFFREVVDPVVIEEGFARHEIGRDKPLSAFMNVEIFEGLHRAGVVVVDLTDVRPNCTMELGYALARRRRVVISAMEGTRLPFDPDKLPTHFWEDAGALEDRVNAYRDWFERHIEMPPMVQ